MKNQTAAPLVLRDLIVTYRRVPAVHHVTGTFEAGSLTALAGPNGAGKSTLLKGLMGLVPLAGGGIERGALSPRQFAYLPQLSEIDRTFPLSVIDTVMLGAWPRTGAFRVIDRKERARAAECIAQVGLAGYERASIEALSAGQWQRALFARLIMQDAAVILLDEPFAAVDEKTTGDLMALVHSWRAQERTIIAVLHDVEFIRRHIPQTLLLAREVVAWGPTAMALSSENLEQARQMTNRWARQAPEHKHAHPAQAAA